MLQMNSMEIKNIDLFASLSEEELSKISEQITFKEFKKNQVILREEETSEYMYMILSGKVKVMQINEEGKETILAFHNPGDFFGELSLIDGKTAPATVVATENSGVALINKKDFFSMLLGQGKVMMRLLNILSTRLREAYDRIQILSFSNAAQRLKMLFIMLAEMYGQKTEKGIRLEIKLTHQNIADMTGIARETVTRIINKAQKENDIILEGKVIYLNPEYLKKDFEIKK